MLMLPPPPPARLEDYRLGARIPAGLGHAVVVPDFDFETYSEAGYVWDDEAQRWTGPPGASGNTKGLPVVGAQPYAADPSCVIVWMAYDLKDGAGRRRWHPGMPEPLDFLGYVAAGGIVEAWNVGFERWIWEHVCVPRMGWPALGEHQVRCAMAKARAFSLPGALGMAAKVLNLETQKDAAGGALMKVFSMPRQPTKSDPRRRVLPVYGQAEFDREYAERSAALAASGKTPRALATATQKLIAEIREEYVDTHRYGDYNVTDIVAEAEASSRVPDLEGEELQWWQIHERINRRGVHVDRAGVENCIAVIEQAFEQYNGELLALTGIDAASKVQQLQGWLHARGLHLDSLDEEAVEQALQLLPPHPPGAVSPVRRVLEIRAAIGSASVKKLYAMRNRLSADDRLRDLYVYYGARTGRSTGEGPQPTNLPKAGPDTIRCGCTHHYGLHLPACPWCRLPRPPEAKVVEWNPAVAEDALAVMGTRSLATVEHVFGNALLTVSGCLRGLYDAAPGHDLISTDYNSIEAVGLAMIAGEQWRIEVFRGDGKIYERSASAAFKVPYESFAAHKAATGQHHALRQKGKVMELACLAPETLVLTRRGYVALLDVQTTDQLWDGIEWVNHKGLVARGTRPVVNLGGAMMTPDHQVLCGRSWLAASQLDSSESTHSQALGTGSANLPFSAASAAATRSAFSSLASAAHRFTASHSATLCMAERPDALRAGTERAEQQSNGTSSMPTSFPTTSTDADCSTGYPPRSGDATTPRTRNTATTAAAASVSPKSGNSTSGRFSAMCSRWRAGISRLWRWIANASTATTNPGTSGSLPAGRICSTSAASWKCNPGSTSLSAVFDIAHAGPRNRFTIKTDRGHLIVHNCGYQGWLGAAKAFEMPGTDDEIKADILAWRAASPSVEWLWGGQTRGKASTAVTNAKRGGMTFDDRLAWLASDNPQARWDRNEFMFGVEGMAVEAVLRPDEWHHVTRLDGTYSGISFRKQGDALYCRIPSGRTLTYHRPALMKSDRGEWSLSYEGWNSNPKNGPTGWLRMPTWGGRLVENIVQATCRDILRRACIELEAVGYWVVLHVYDEIVAEIREGWGSIEEFERIVTEKVQQALAWARDWPIRAPGGYRAKRYRKG